MTFFVYYFDIFFIKMEYQKSQVRPKNDDYDDFDEDIWDEDIGKAII